MKRLAIALCCLACLSCGLVPAALATVDLTLSSATTAATGPVSVVVTPNGAGHTLGQAYLFGGITEDATITLVLLDTQGDPIAGYPRDDLWLETSMGGLFGCNPGTIADADTDANGETTFSGTIYAGGYTDRGAGELTQVIVSGQALVAPGLDIQFNSPDMDGDGIFNLADVPIAAETYFSGYHYRLDFYWDGVINLSDVVIFAQLVSTAYGTGCP